MYSNRTIIFQRLQQALQRSDLTADSVQALETRLATPPINTQPTIKETVLTQFTTCLTKVAATYTLVTEETTVPETVLNFLQTHQLPLTVVMDANLKHLTWQTLEIAYRAAQDTDQVSVSKAFAGVAETGSLVLLSTAESPTTLNFLPETHIMIVYQTDIVMHLEAVWSRLRSQLPELPRVINFITGPSRTADIEQTIQLGAHGPRTLHVIIVA